MFWVATSQSFFASLSSDLNAVSWWRKNSSLGSMIHMPADLLIKWVILLRENTYGDQLPLLLELSVGMHNRRVLAVIMTMYY